MSTAQVESVMVEHPKVAEAAVVAAPHAVKGECLYCFVTPKEGVTITDEMKKELRTLVRERIAPFASPDFIQVRNVCFKFQKHEFSFIFNTFFPRNSLFLPH